MARSSRQRALEQQRAQQLVTRATVATSFTSGPLPPPADLERYDAIVPGMAERLLVKFEEQAVHRMALERYVIRADVRRANVGLIASSVFGVLVLIASVVLILTGHEGAGTTALVVEFLTYGGAFLYGSETRRRERNRKVGR